MTPAKCDKCGRVYKMKDHSVGKRFHCKGLNCDGIVTIPSSTLDDDELFLSNLNTAVADINRKSGNNSRKKLGHLKNQPSSSSDTLTDIIGTMCVFPLFLFFLAPIIGLFGVELFLDTTYRSKGPFIIGEEAIWYETSWLSYWFCITWWACRVIGFVVCVIIATLAVLVCVVMFFSILLPTNKSRGEEVNLTEQLFYMMAAIAYSAVFFSLFWYVSPGDGRTSRAYRLSSTWLHTPINHISLEGLNKITMVYHKDGLQWVRRGFSGTETYQIVFLYESGAVKTITVPRGITFYSTDKNANSSKKAWVRVVSKLPGFKSIGEDIKISIKYSNTTKRENKNGDI
jgi:hypothetical protein